MTSSWRRSGRRKEEPGKKKSEARIPGEASRRDQFETIPKFKWSKLVSNLGHLIFAFVSSFDTRISDLSIFIESCGGRLHQQPY
jgi:hypothetical protein